MNKVTRPKLFVTIDKIVVERFATTRPIMRLAKFVTRFADINYYINYRYIGTVVTRAGKLIIKCILAESAIEPCTPPPVPN